MSQAETFDRDSVSFGEWSLAEWNAALVRQIFMRPERAATKLSRVDTTGRMLKAIAGEGDEETAKRCFIAAFGSDPSSIKRQYTWSPRIPAITLRDGIPPTFAALYLSLLAASADENTFEEGDFRRRFSSLLNVPDLAAFDFSELPKLWKHFAGWTRSRQRSNRDCAQLLLPDPQHETRIGQSKRLAFPSYRDELKLRAALKSSGMDSDSGFAQVSAAVHSRLTSFSSSFREELVIFNQLVVKGRQLEAYESPFWGAIRDISQENEEEQAEAHGRFCVVLDASDPRYPEFCLLADSRGLQSLSDRERAVLNRSTGNYRLMWCDPAGSMRIDAIAALATRSHDFARSRTGASLVAGWIALFPDSVGTLTTDGAYYEGGPAALASRREFADRVASTCSDLGISWLGASAQDAKGEWKTMVFPSISLASLARLSVHLPGGAKELVQKGWRPPQPHLSGGAWFGQALLLNPASNPVVRLEGCVAGRFTLVDGKGGEIASGELVTSDDGLCIPPVTLMDTRGVVACRYVLGGDEGTTLEVPIVAEIPALDHRQLADREAWLTDGASGLLAGLDSVHDRPAAASNEALPSPLIGNWPLLEPMAASALASLAPIADCKLQQPFSWIAEVLALRYSRRASLPFADLRSHLDMVEAATDISTWQIRRLLLAGGWLSTVERRTSPYPTLMLAERMISCTSVEGRSIARISGMFQEAELNSLKQSLNPNEGTRWLGSDSVPAAISCLEVWLDSEDRARELASLHRLAWFPQQSSSNPLAGILNPTSEFGFREVMRPNLPLEQWDSGGRRWLEPRALADEPPVGSLFKAQGNQRNTFWIKSKDGFFATDSSSWAWLAHALQIEGSLGTMAANGDVAWSRRIMSLPGTLSRWWLHLGGGCIGIDAQGGLLFLGGIDKSIWAGVADGTLNRAPARMDAGRALERRALALRIRRRDP